MRDDDDNDDDDDDGGVHDGDDGVVESRCGEGCGVRTTSSALVANFSLLWRLSLRISGMCPRFLSFSSRKVSD
jgi:hypothetical protein